MARFGDWCIEQCRRNGIKKVLACTREAETFVPLLKTAIRGEDTPLEVIPFYVSREAICRAFLFPLNFPKLYRILTVKRKPHSIRQLLAWLKMDPENCAKILTIDDMDTPLPAASPTIYGLCRAILASEECATLLAKVAIKAREEFLSYFNGICWPGEHVAVMDLGFAGTTQGFIEEILREVSSTVRISGLYFCLNQAAASHALKDEDVSSYLGRLGMQLRETMLMTRHPEIFEQSLIGPGGTVLGYENGQPILERVIPGYSQVIRTAAVRRGIFAFQEKWHQFKAKLRASGSKLSPQAYLDMDSRNAVILQRLFQHPLKSEADAFGQLHHDDNFGSKTGGTICSDVDFVDLSEHGYEALVRQGKCYWPLGVYHSQNGEIPNIAFLYFSQMNK
jgi:hypothetical protein